MIPAVLPKVWLASANAVDRIANVMFAEALPHIRRWRTALLRRPLTLREALIVGSVLLVVGTIYCQIYCLLALQQMHGASMSLGASVHRASVDIVPAFVAFELSKRVSSRGRWWQWLVVALIFAAAITLAVLWRMDLHVMTNGLTPRRMAVDRIPFMALAAAGLAYFHLWPILGDQAPIWRRASDELDLMPPPRAIDWVKAAGNYVEIQVGGRTKLIRGTLRETSAKLPKDQFVQIHRSVIVNRDRIARVHGRRSVEVTDGTEFPIGDAYRSNLNGD